MATGKPVHHYRVTVTWAGNRGAGTQHYRAYGRDHLLAAAGKPDIAGSADPAFLGDPARWNPEELLVGALSACHKLWYLHLCASHGISVTAYADEAEGSMIEDSDRGGWFTGVILRPLVTLRAGDDAALALSLHEAAHAKCFIANSVNFPVLVEAVVG
ncbi:MAG TPA: OsmC family protein [Beijerinckiaceae bacterium]|nr:OsmC family protein [Beijerinckiaceae bacterium]